MARRIGRLVAPLVDGLAALNSGGRGRVLLAIAGGWFLSIGVRLIYPAVLPNLRVAFGFDLTTAGLLLTVLWAVYAIGQFPGGVLCDRLGSGRVVIASTVATTLAVALVVLSPTVTALFATTALLGLCTALYGPARFPLLSAVFPDRNGTAVGLTQAAGNLGNSVLPVVAGTLAGVWVWRVGFGFVVPLFVAGTAALWWVVPRRPEETTVETLSGDAVRYLISDFTSRSVLVVVAIQVLGSSMYQGFTGFYPTYLTEVKGLSPALSSGLFGLFFAMGMLVQPLTGGAGDRFGERRVLFVVLGAATVMLAALPFVTRLPALVAITIGLSSLLGRGVLTLTYLTNVLSEETRGTGLGLLRTGYMLIGATSPFLIGVLADAGQFDEAFWLLSASGAAMILLCTVLPERG